MDDADLFVIYGLIVMFTAIFLFLYNLLDATIIFGIIALIFFIIGLVLRSGKRKSKVWDLNHKSLVMQKY